MNISIKLAGKVDTSNAATVEKEIFGLLDQYQPGKVIMGYAGIKYAITPAVNKNQDPQLCQRIATKAREQIIPNARLLIGAIHF